MSERQEIIFTAGARWIERDGTTLDRYRAGLSKRSFDVVAALEILLIILPLLALIALALLTQGRQLLIRHRGIGRGGRLFRCLKFRTTVVNGDDMLRQNHADDPAARDGWAGSQKLKDDPRVRPLGRVLRKFSLDELPQLFNVVFGHVSLVGPRPIVPAEAAHYGVHIAKYNAVRPGLTGFLAATSTAAGPR